MLISICKQGYINRILEEIRHTRSHELEVTDICLSIMQYLQKTGHNKKHHTNHCSLFNDIGHNARTCNAPGARSNPGLINDSIFKYLSKSEYSI